MRHHVAITFWFLLAACFSPAPSWLQAQVCAGLCLQQVSCPNGGTTSVSGTIYAPNGIDPLPNVLVFIPSAPVAAFPAGLSCPAPGQQPSGIPLVGSTTAVDGTFSIANVPVGRNIPLVVQIGKWRRQLVVPDTAACADTAFSTRLPRNQTEGDIPHIAIVTSSTDQMECVLRATGVDDAEFTNPGGGGRINLFTGAQLPGGQIDPSTPDEFSLMTNPAKLNAYDQLMLPSQGSYSAPSVSANQQSTLAGFVNAGGRAYLSHFEWTYLDKNAAIELDRQPPGMWWVDNPPYTPNAPYSQTTTATVNLYLPEAQTMADWLQASHVTSTSGILQFNRQTQSDIVYSAVQTWFRNSDPPDYGNVLQIVAQTPIQNPPVANACGRLVFDDYEVRPTGALAPVHPLPTFPGECASGFLSPEEKAFEYALFELTPDQPATLAPVTFDFGTSPIGVASSPQTFTWTNNSSFPATATPSTVGPDFKVASTTCGVVPAKGQCEVAVVFQPTALRLLSSYIVVKSTGLLGTEQSFIQGTGTQDLTFNTNYLQFGTHPVGSTTTLALMASNIAPFVVPLQPLVVTGDFTVSPGNCGLAVPANASCTLQISFQPTKAGERTGTLTPPGTEPVNLEGVGGDFSISVSPTSGNIEAGKTIKVAATVAPVGQFTGAVDLACMTDAPVTTCSVAPSVGLGQGSVSTSVTVQTTSKYTVPGYGYGRLRAAPLARGLVPTLAACLPWLCVVRRKRKPLSSALALILLCAAMFLSLAGCSSKYPALNPAYTPAGTYTVTLSATSMGLTHTAAYTLVVRQ